ncbi:UPF0223 family protein [Bacillus tuaregi]|uniref:UPF0223 family protein n=1 Tax=Bacillus tuaregi TaxID=1816695 RepID=UPI0008F908F2|nr:UPF0223 family protein [Bacillus tuaregi]
MEYQYPIDPDWSTEEIIDVIRFFETIEQAYEKGVKRELLLDVYRRFKEIVPGKAQEKKLCAEFEVVSGYSFYRTMKKGKEADSDSIIRMHS